MKNSCNKVREGFTLVELSIVIIIIGFLIAGISAGTSLIKQASLNKIITDAQNYSTAIYTFKLKYYGYPGDFADANAYWSATTSGNGNGLIEWFDESHTAWQQLALSGMIGGTYDGTTEEAIAAYGQGNIWRLESNGDDIYTIPANSKNSLEIFAPSALLISGPDAYVVDSKIDDGIPSNGKVYGIDYFGLC
jgi:prepilin-type N-terminal cleavage/methylation domain-containing protein